jgi:UDP-N-acetylmuramate dehydrogenase
MNWFSGFERSVRTDVPLREHTWYKLGGPARWFCEPRDEAELVTLIGRLHAARIPWRVLGGGTNVVVRDEGFDGAVIHLDCPAFRRIGFAQEKLHAGAGADLQKLIQATFKHGLVGLEVLAGIPGTIGGAVRMNAGGRHGEVGSFVRSVRLLDSQGVVHTRAADKVGFAYRHSDLDGCVILSVVLELQRGDSEAALARYRELRAERRQLQPPVAARTAGCIFKNPPGEAAGRLLDQAGLKGTRVGGAEISTAHANFIVADDSATAADVLDLIQLAKDRVRKTAGIELEPEVDIW